MSAVQSGSSCDAPLQGTQFHALVSEVHEEGRDRSVVDWQQSSEPNISRSMGSYVTISFNQETRFRYCGITIEQEVNDVSYHPFMSDGTARENPGVHGMRSGNDIKCSELHK